MQPSSGRHTHTHTHTIPHQQNPPFGVRFRARHNCGISSAHVCMLCKGMRHAARGTMSHKHTHTRTHAHAHAGTRANINFAAQLYASSRSLGIRARVRGVLSTIYGRAGGGCRRRVCVCAFMPPVCVVAARVRSLLQKVACVL